MTTCEEVVDVDAVSWSDFFRRYLEPCQPVIVRDTSLVSNWFISSLVKEIIVSTGETTATFNNGNVPIMSETVALTSDMSRSAGGPNTRLDISLFVAECQRRAGSDLTVPVADCDTLEYGSHTKTEMKLSEYAEYWLGLSHHSYSGQKLLYLKDFHIVCQLGDGLYCRPPYFSSDVLNHFYTHSTDNSDDYRFLYLGPAGSHTPPHADVIRSHSWSANISGVKRWRLLPPQCDIEILSRTWKYNPENSSCLDCLTDSHILEILQGPGEILFVPSGWWHDVENLTDCLSINHNWVTPHSLARSVRYLKEEQAAVEAAINDCRGMEDWSAECEKLLRCHAGLNWEDLVALLETAAPEWLKRRQLAEEDHLERPSTSSSRLASDDTERAEQGRITREEVLALAAAAESVRVICSQLGLPHLTDRASLVYTVLSC